jgi:hypothetical protein
MDMSLSHNQTDHDSLSHNPKFHNLPHIQISHNPRHSQKIHNLPRNQTIHSRVNRNLTYKFAVEGHLKCWNTPQ